MGILPVTSRNASQLPLRLCAVLAISTVIGCGPNSDPVEPIKVEQGKALEQSAPNGKSKNRPAPAARTGMGPG